MRHEQIMFVHFSICTFAGCEQNTACRDNSPDLFNPSGLNVTQVQVARAACSYPLLELLAYAG